MSEAALSSKPRYTELSEQKASGATYTPENLANFVAKQILNSMPHRDKNEKIEVLDPATGDGALLVAIAKELETAGFQNIVLNGIETNADALNLAKQRIDEEFPNATVNLEVGDFLKIAVDRNDTSNLFSFGEKKLYDLVIANPPYVRTQILGAAEAQRLAKSFGLSGRVDLYYPFILAMGMVLKEDGILGVITSNRYMTTKAGGAVRQAIRENFYLKHVWDLGDTKLFDAAVLPAVMIAAKNSQNQEQGDVAYSTIYESKEIANLTSNDPIGALDLEGIVQIANGRVFEVRHGKLDDGGVTTGVWRISTSATDDWLSVVESNTWGTFEKIGKVRVGVKTTADKIFIGKDWHKTPEEDRPELLRPLTTHYVARRFKAEQITSPREIIYTHEVVNGKRRAIDLEAYPKTKAFLEGHREKLEARSYVKKAGRNWYEVWVPQDPSAWPRPKLVMRDISEEPCFWMDLDGTIINGDCYWMIAPEGKEDLLWLALGIGNSKFIEEFYDHKFHNKLYSGRRRFITQYVKEFPIPDPTLEASEKIVELCKKIYQCSEDSTTEALEASLNKLVYEAFGVSGN